VFALRDFSNHHNLEKEKTSFAKDINQVWGKIMPKGQKIGDYFEIEYVPLPNKWVEEANFIEQVDQLKTRF
jgi:hypothetical protein